MTKEHLLEALSKLRQAQERAANESGESGALATMQGLEKVELRVPAEDDVEGVYDSMTVVEEGLLSQDEYLIVLFRVTLENSD